MADEPKPSDAKRQAAMKVFREVGEKFRVRQEAMTVFREVRERARVAGKPRRP